ncbi:nucleotidyltransferase [Bacillus sp. EB01]|uniref:nucleotidyltransferase n=1 Tax=Bacillus sp. EB01 TaxID=1347086 RepID=UPI0005C79870|nr:nucleotidyltransferase [Bacillus sp. EB01]
MNAVGIVVEYNPFHNGHLYHLHASKEISGSDIVIAAMSGNFLQRGEPALASKWARTKMALLNGVDIVFEIPYQYAVQKAEIFASGAVSILQAAGCSSLCFGSEAGDAGNFISTVEFLEEHEEEFNSFIKKHMKSGVSYPRAASLALSELNGPEGMIPLSQPNNILGFHYVKSIRDQGSSMKPLTVKRKNAQYHDEDFSSANIASATSIRKAFFSDALDIPAISAYIPTASASVLQEYINTYGSLHQWEQYWPLLKYKLLQARPGELAGIYEAEEGLENRLAECSRKADTFAGFMELAKTKRYTWTRIQRLCTHILVNANKSEMDVRDGGQPGYLRLLGMTASGRSYLNKMKGSFPIQLVSKLSGFSDPGIELDTRAASIYSMAIPGSNGQRLLELEYRQPPIYMG